MEGVLKTRLESLAVVLLIALTCTGVGVLTPTALAARLNETAQAKSKADKRADAPRSAAKDQAKPNPNFPTLLGDAVDELNRKTKGHFDTKILRQPPLEKHRWPKVPGVYALLEPLEERVLGGEAEGGRQSVPACAHEDRRLVPTQPSPADRGTTPDLGAETARSLHLLRWRGGEPSLFAAVPLRDAPCVAEVAVTPQPASTARVPTGR